MKNRDCSEYTIKDTRRSGINFDQEREYEGLPKWHGQYPKGGGVRFMHALCPINSRQLTESIKTLVLLLITPATLRDGRAETERPQLGSISIKPQVIRPSVLTRHGIIRQKPTYTDKLACYIKQSSDWTPLQRQTEINGPKVKWISRMAKRELQLPYTCHLNTALTVHAISLSDCLVILHWQIILASQRAQRPKRGSLKRTRNDLAYRLNHLGSLHHY
jgi:hypothetical protein